jgi:hypothetical protein
MKYYLYDTQSGRICQEQFFRPQERTVGKIIVEKAKNSQIPLAILGDLCYNIENECLKDRME